ncbi:MAG: NADH-quinone oxidoreductase subunit K [Polyangiaceae bacterium]|nr:NADH-quinone oxidoreductase subunit K [Polyangiaceae bacterium]
MIWALALAAGAIVGAGVYLSLSRHLLRVVVGVSLIGAAANLVLLAMARATGPEPPVIRAGEVELAAGLDPLPQALVLTAIVIGFSLTCFSLVLVLAIAQRTRDTDGDALRAAEPHPDRDGKPPVEGDA